MAAVIVLRKDATVKILDMVVPVMAVCYFAITILIIVMNLGSLPGVLQEFLRKHLIPTGSSRWFRRSPNEWNQTDCFRMKQAPDLLRVRQQRQNVTSRSKPDWYRRSGYLWIRS